MILAAFLAICGAGAILGLSLQDSTRASRVSNLLALACAAAAAAALGSSGQSLTVGDVQLATTSYSAAFLAVAAASCLLLCVIGLAAYPPEAVARLAPAALAAFGGFGVAFTSGDPRVSLIAGTAAAATGTLTLVKRPGDGEGDGRIAELRILGLIAVAMLLAAVVVMRPAWVGPQDRAFGVAFLALALAVAVRGGAIPFHIPTSHLARNATPSAVALLSVFVPAGLGALVLTWSPIAFRANSSWMDFGLGTIQVVAVATILLGALAAVVHDRIDEVLAYSIVSDAGFILLALAARTEDAAEPARLWLLVFVAGKTALVAWVAATNRAFGTTELAELRGWLRRTPLLGLALIAIAAATLGWPGSGVATARAEIVRLGLPGGLGFVGGLAIALSIAYYGRLLLIGLLRPSAVVRESWSERPRLGFSLRRPKEKPVATESAAEAGTEATLEGVAADKVKSAEKAELAAVKPELAAEAAEATEAVAAADSDKPVETERPEGPAQPAPAGKRKRRSRAAAAQEPLPSVSAEVPADQAPAIAPTPEADSSTKPATETATAASVLVVPKPRRRGPSLRHRLGLVWRLNRTLEVSFVVGATAILSLGVAAGTLGSSHAAKAGLPLGTAAHATSSPTAAPSLAPTQAPLASGTPFVTAPPSSPTTSPGASVTPEHTSGPTPIIK